MGILTDLPGETEPRFVERRRFDLVLDDLVEGEDHEVPVREGDPVEGDRPRARPGHAEQHFANRALEVRVTASGGTLLAPCKGSGHRLPPFTGPQPAQESRSERAGLVRRPLRPQRRDDFRPHFVQGALAGLPAVLDPHDYGAIALDLHRLAVVPREHVFIERGRDHRSVAKHLVARFAVPGEVAALLDRQSELLRRVIQVVRLLEGEVRRARSTCSK